MHPRTQQRRTKADTSRKRNKRITGTFTSQLQQGMHLLAAEETSIAARGSPRGGTLRPRAPPPPCGWSTRTWYSVKVVNSAKPETNFLLLQSLSYERVGAAL